MNNMFAEKEMVVANNGTILNHVKIVHPEWWLMVALCDSQEITRWGRDDWLCHNDCLDTEQ